jgi:glycosyltransferase involved in cell wall biosynthesis
MNRALRVAQLSYQDIGGGAGRASHRLHQALRAEGIDSRQLVRCKDSDDWTVTGPTGRAGKALALLRTHGGHALVRALGGPREAIHSLALWPSRWPERVAAGLDGRIDLVHLHWVGGESLSLADIARLPRPAVWTLHDMWAFCGAEHYASEAPDARWRRGYPPRPPQESGPGLVDIDRWTFRRKQRAWTRPLQLVAPSRWMAEQVRASALMPHWPVAVLPNAIDTTRFAPLDRGLARQLLGLPAEGPLLLFGALGGAVGGAADARKGFDLLATALGRLRAQGAPAGLALAVFGQSAPRQPPELGFPVHFLGRLHDDATLRLAYAAADAFVIPSRQDNLPNTGVEALACGTPLVAFGQGGLPDLVDHRHNGWLARAFDADELAAGLAWVLQAEQAPSLRAAARAKAEACYAAPVVARAHAELYRAVLAGAAA